MGLLGIVTGTIGKEFSLGLESEERIIKTAFGKAFVMVGHDFALVERHGGKSRRHILPHLINHQANMQALKDLQVDEIVALQSTGSLKKALQPGALIVPHDFINLSGGPTIFSTEGEHAHVIPSIDENVRAKLLKAAKKSMVEVHDSGVYWQTKGPRLETKAEIALMAEFADIVGMTMASEAIIARELDLPYASLCCIDNYAHGIGVQKLSLADIAEYSAKNAVKALTILESLISSRRGA